VWTQKNRIIKTEMKKREGNGINKKTVHGRARDKKRCVRKYQSGYGHIGQGRKVSVTMYRSIADFTQL
jgi:hypothetical protein